jgi:hypothetical protein
MLGYLAEPSADAVACAVGVTAQTVSRCLDRAAELDVIEASDDRQRTGRDPTITAEARTWLVALACQKPKALGYWHELWTTRLLAAHARDRGPAAGRPVWPDSPKGRCARSSPITRSSRTRAGPREDGGALLLEKRDPGIRAQDGGSPVHLSPSRGVARAGTGRGERRGGHAGKPGHRLL